MNKFPMKQFKIFRTNTSFTIIRWWRN